MYDVVYSIIFHESPECVNDLLRNIKKYNRGVHYMIVANINFHIAGKLPECGFNEVLINPNVCNKQVFTTDILLAHMSNMQYLQNRGTGYKYFCPLASNCMFASPLPYKKIEEFFVDKTVFPSVHPKKYIDPPNEWHWPAFKSNQRLVEKFVSYHIPWQIGQLEGRFYPRLMVESVYGSIEKLELLKDITCQTSFEEIIPASMELYLFGFNVPVVCKIFWHRPEYVPTVEDIAEVKQDEKLCVVKRIHRNYYDPLRVYIRGF